MRLILLLLAGLYSLAAEPLRFNITLGPAIAPNGSSWGHEAGDIHNILVYVLLGFIVLHVAGALYHYFVLRDRVLQRMLPANGSS